MVKLLFCYYSGSVKKGLVGVQVVKIRLVAFPVAVQMDSSLMMEC